MATRTVDEGTVPKRVYRRDARGRFAPTQRSGRAKPNTGRGDATKRSSSVKLTANVQRFRIAGRLIEYQPKVAEALLEPLRKGEPVWLKVDDLRLPKKTRKYSTFLFICPFKTLGYDAPRLLVAMPPYGSEVLNPRTDLKATVLARLGLSFSLASALADALRKTLWRSHGN